jgi:hypothetical protein
MPVAETSLSLCACQRGELLIQSRRPCAPYQSGAVAIGASPHAHLQPICFFDFCSALQIEVGTPS